MLLTEKPIRENVKSVSGQATTQKKYAYDKLRKGDTIDVEIYKTSKGEYKISPEGSPVDFLLYCAAIPGGIFWLL